MRPGLRPGRIIIAIYPVLRLQVGDIVVVQHGNTELVKRIHALEPERLFVQGHDDAASTDSRSFGWLEHAAVRGKVIWPRPATTMPPWHG